MLALRVEDKLFWAFMLDAMVAVAWMPWWCWTSRWSVAVVDSDPCCEIKW